MKPFKSLSDVYVQGERPWLSYGFYGAMIFGVFYILLIAFGLNFLTPAGAEMVLVPVVAGMVICIFYCTFRSFTQEEAREHLFWELLQDIGIDTLRQASVSQELDTATRQSITLFLNDRHPGWSFSQKEAPC